MTSGKSTLLFSILRTVEPASGSIRIDSLDHSRISHSALRKHFVVVPQDPLHLIGTVRFNIDPFGRSGAATRTSITTFDYDNDNDDAIISALEKVGLWTTLLERGGLDAELCADTLSKGQQQLLGLARALFQKETRGAKIVLLDEATSSADAETSRVVNETLKREFEGCTVVMIAHRRETILSADVVVVMEKGAVVEIGEPKGLMEDVGSKLRGLLIKDKEVVDVSDSQSLHLNDRDSRL